MARTDSLLVVLGNQLFAAKHLPPPSEVSVFLAEDMGLCTYVRHHQQKIVLFLAAMRAYRDELRSLGYDVTYRQLDAGSEESYEHKLEAALKTSGARRLLHFEVEDKPMESRLIEFARSNDVERCELRSPMFTCTRSDFQAYASDRNRLLMADFYKQQRQRLGILVGQDGQPQGGRWSFDEDNRKKLPKTVTVPDMRWAPATEHVTEVIALVQTEFAHHPGRAAEFCWPTTRQQARDWLDDFVADRLDDFGPYEDAMTTRSATVFHSALTPCLNLGLLTPDEVVDAVLRRAGDAPLASVEGFVRQVIGWREFIRGIYQNFSGRQDGANFWDHQRDLTDAWYDGTTGIVPLDDTITTAQRLGWTHHIPRLMVLGNLMTLCEIRPDRAHRWFMEMYVDSSEWVMGPNVYGMGLFSDGGIFATKPYICGSNYLLKMSDYGKGPWCDIVDGLYWRFIDKHRAFFSANPRLALMPRALDRLDDDRRTRITEAAETFLANHTRH
ncbi:MAG: cryptochrome/photolyase family protein [Gammaproteobacteria bacterium]|nr:cryptochrome/photolyase family protein [Gammaproteobacteria bacterium]